MKIGIFLPLTGLIASTPSSLTPVLSFATSVRSKSDLRAASSRYAATASRGEYAQRIARGGGEIDLRALGSADPVALLRLDALYVVDVVEVAEQALGVLGYLQHPLALGLADDLAAAAFADAADDLFVGEDALAGGAEVDRHLLLIREPALEKLQEYPLRPLEIVGVGGVDLSVPVEGKAERFELALETRDIVARDDLGVDLILDGVVLGREAEGVPAHRIKDVVTAQTLLARDDVERGVGARMPDVKSGAGGVRELHERVKLRLLAAGNGGEGLELVPFILPFFLYRFEIVSHIELFSLRIIYPLFPFSRPRCKGVRDCKTLLLRGGKRGR